MQHRHRRGLVFGYAALLAVALGIAASPADAHTGRVPVQHALSFATGAPDDTFSGRLTSTAGECNAARTVTLYREDLSSSLDGDVVATLSTDGQGAWLRASAAVAPGRYYAVAPELGIRQASHRHTCEAARSNTVTLADGDADGILDSRDNCPAVANPAQEDADGDANGDACDPDADGDGSTVAAGDCDDRVASRHPGASEATVNGIDDDCDGLVDEDAALYADADGDWYSPAGGDCDDTNAEVNPEAFEAEDGIDNDCNGVVDDVPPPIVDEDGDLSSPPSDCDDTNALVHPGAHDVGDGLDNDCDGSVDEDAWRFTDGDGDGYTPHQNDCNDADALVNPGAADVRDGIDNNCDTLIDEPYCWSPSSTPVMSDTMWTQATQPSATGCAYGFRVFNSIDTIMFVADAVYHSYAPAAREDTVAFTFAGRGWRYVGTYPNCCIETA